MSIAIFVVFWFNKLYEQHMEGGSMEKHDPAVNKKRVRSDRLIGFRIPLDDFIKLNSLLGQEKVSISRYMRNLLKDDLQRTSSRSPQEP